LPTLRLVLSLGLPDPDRLSTALLWSLIGHLGLLTGVFVYESLPSQTPPSRQTFFVRLAGPTGPSPGTGGGAGPSPPKQAEPIEKARAADSETVPLRPQPSKASIPPEKTEKTLKAASKVEKHAPAPPDHAHETTKAPAGTGGEEPAGSTGKGPAGGEPGSAGVPGGMGVPGAIGGTSFGEGDFRYAWYQAAIETKLQSVWRKPVASSEEIQTTTVTFTILRSGAIQTVSVATPSGNAALDLSVMRAVYDANPMPALPRGWDGDSVHVSMEFRLAPGT
jgi:protein TonB